MSETFTTQRMLALRKLTRAATGIMEQHLKDALSAVGPLMQPKSLLGDYIRGVKEPVRGAEALFRSVAELYQEVAAQKPFGVPGELSSPLDLRNTSVDVTPMEYSYTAKVNGTSKQVRVTSPFVWVLHYRGYSPEDLKTLLGSVSPSDAEIRSFVLHYVTLRFLVMQQAPLTKILSALRYSVTEATQPEFGKLPFIHIGGPISTVRPPDEIIIETTEMTGSDGFEEVIDLKALAALRDPVREELVDLAKAHGEKV